ncbi:hypothetical protein WN943_003353 [Citrus x changshan-huyou]
MIESNIGTPLGYCEERLADMRCISKGRNRKHPEAAKFWIKDIDHAFMFDELVRDVTTTEARAWATTSGVTPLLYNHSNFENIIEDNIAPVDSANSEEVNHDEIGCSDYLEKIPPRRK